MSEIIRKSYLSLCPFCGGKADISLQDARNYDDSFICRVYCVDCGASIKRQYTVPYGTKRAEKAARSYIAEFWNKRNNAELNIILGSNNGTECIVPQEELDLNIVQKFLEKSKDAFHLPNIPSVEMYPIEPSQLSNDYVFGGMQSAIYRDFRRKVFGEFPIEAEEC